MSMYERFIIKGVLRVECMGGGLGMGLGKSDKNDSECTMLRTVVTKMTLRLAKGILFISSIFF